jgi:hypothetical protein
MIQLNSDEKIACFNLTIEKVLDKYNKTWRDDTLYSWFGTVGYDNLDAATVYGKNGVIFKDIKRDSYPMSVPNDITSKFFVIANKTIPRVDNSNKFILELSVPLFKNTAPYMFVVSNIHPDTKLFGEDRLYSGIGEWRTGLV